MMPTYQEQTIEQETPVIGAALTTSAGLLQEYQVINDGLNASHIVDQQTFLTSNPLLSYLLVGAGFVGTALNIQETWKSFKALYTAENKNFEKVTKFAINLFRSITLGLFWGSLATGATLALPYLLPIGAAVGAAWELYHVSKKTYQAYQFHQLKDKANRNRVLKEIIPHLFFTAVNGLSTGVSLVVSYVGSSLKTAANMFSDGMKNGNFKEIIAAINLTQTTNRVYETFKPLVYTLGAVLSLGTATTFTLNAARQFDETKAALSHPVTSLKQFANATVEKAKNARNFLKKTYLLGTPVVAVVAAAEVASFTITGIVRLAQFAVVGLFKSIAKLFGKKKEAMLPEPLKPTSSSNDPIVKMMLQQETQRVALEKQHQAEMEKQHQLAEVRHQQEVEIENHYKGLKQLIQRQRNALEKSLDNQKNLAKVTLLVNIENNLGDSFENYKTKETQVIAQLEKEAKNISPLLCQSFFRVQGRTESILASAKRLETNLATYRSAPAA